MASPRAVVAFALGLSLIVATGCSRDPVARRTEYVRAGDGLLKAKKYEQAVTAYANAVKADPRSGEARLKLADSLMAVGNLRRAFTEYQRAADLLPKSIEAQLKAGQLNLLGGRYEDARVRAQKVLAIDPRNTSGHILFGNALAGLNDFEHSIAEMQTAIETSPEGIAGYRNLGVVELRRGEIERAEEAFKRALTVAPNSTEPRIALANFYWSQNRKGDVERLLNEVLKMEPNNAPARRGLATLFLTTNRIPEAEPHIRALVAVDPKDVDAQLGLADYFVFAARPSDARAVLEKLVLEHTREVRVLTRVASVRFALGDRKSANAALDTALGINAKDFSAQLMKSQFLLADNKLTEAQERARAALDLQPESPEAQYTLGSIAIARRDPAAARMAFLETLKRRPQWSDPKLQLARLSLDEGHAQEALTYASEAAAARPSDPVAQSVLGRALLANGRAGTDGAMKQLVEKFPKSAAIKTIVGDFHAAKSETAAARTAYNEALAIDPQSPGALTGLVALDLRAGKRADARARVDKALKDNPSSVQLHMLSARVAATVKDYKLTETELRRVVELNPGDPQGYARLAALYVQQRRLEDAKKEFTTVIAMNSQVAPAQTMMGLIYQAEGNNAEAMKSYERALEANPNLAVAANNLAWLQLQEGQNLDVALQNAQKAVSLAPSQPGFLHTLGSIYLKKGLGSLAVQNFTECTRLQAQNAGYWFNLGQAYVSAGDKPKAKAALAQALKLKPNLADAQAAMQQLDRQS